VIPKIRIINKDVTEGLKQLKSDSVNCCVTSPPYWGLRDYGTAKWEGGNPDCDHKDPIGKPRKQTSNAGSVGLGARSVCRRCGALRRDRQIGLEKSPQAYVDKLVTVFREVKRVLKDDGTVWLNLGDSYASNTKGSGGQSAKQDGLKPKDLVGIPWRVAFALQADGWYLRQDIIWCLSGGTWLYVRTQKGDMPMTVKDVARLDPTTVKLWNGRKWTQLLGMSKSERRGDELEIVLRSGERISCTPTHRFPSSRGLVDASELRVGDTLKRCQLPEPESPRDCAIDDDAAWFAGLFIAEGSRSEDTIQIAGHAKESARWERVQAVAKKFGGYAATSEDGNNQSIRVFGKVLNAILDELVTGRTAHDKGFAPVVWRYSNRFLEAMLDGYLSGDGHKDGNRWRLGFCRNYNLERDLRTVCARLGYTLTLNMASTPYNDKQVPTFRGELRKTRSGHHNERDRREIVEIRKARCRHVYDLGVADEPHLFALASGVLTHNSKPNTMPESVHDRCTKAHEYVFLLTKSSNYWYDADAIKEQSKKTWNSKKKFGTERPKLETMTERQRDMQRTQFAHQSHHDDVEKSGRNARDVWSISTQGYPEAHFATFPEELPRRCILAGCPKGGVVLDPFAGSGTTGYVARTLKRNAILIELNPEYVKLIEKRVWEPKRLRKAVKRSKSIREIVKTRSRRARRQK
jgi:DNA modification methylase